MLKLYIIIVLMMMAVIYFRYIDCNIKELFTAPDASSPPPPPTYTEAEKTKIMTVLKDNYDIDALLNIAMIAKGLQTDGYTVPGKLITSSDLEVKGKLKVGSNITISSDTTGDVITVGDGTKVTDGKTKINIGKYSLVPNLSGTDDYIEVRYNKDGVATNDKVIGKFSRDAGDKVVVYTNADNSNYFFINSEPSLGIYNNTQGSSGDIGRLRVNTVEAGTVKANDIKNMSGGFVVRGADNEETKLCDGSTDCKKYIYIRNNINEAGFYKKASEDIYFDVKAPNKPTIRLKTQIDPYVRVGNFSLQDAYADANITKIITEEPVIDKRRTLVTYKNL